MAESVENISSQVVNKLATEMVGLQTATEIRDLWGHEKNDEARQKYSEWVDSEQRKFANKISDKEKDLVKYDEFSGAKDAQDYVYRLAQKTVISAVPESKLSTDFAFAKLQELARQGITPTKEVAARLVAVAQTLVDSQNIQSVSSEEAEFVNSYLSGKPDDGKAMSISESDKLGRALVEVAMAKEYLKNEAEKIGVGTGEIKKFGSLEGTNLNGELNKIPDWRMDLRNFQVPKSNEKHLGSLVLESVVASK